MKRYSRELVAASPAVHLPRSEAKFDFVVVDLSGS